jgi:hypothetical protein
MGNDHAIDSLSVIAGLGDEREIRIASLILKTHVHTAVEHYILATYSDNHAALSHILTSSCNQINQPQHPPTRNNFAINNLIRASERAPRQNPKEAKETESTKTQSATNMAAQFCFVLLPRGTHLIIIAPGFF